MAIPVTRPSQHEIKQLQEGAVQTTALAPANGNQHQSHSFKAASTVVKRRMIVCIEGVRGHGKTDFSLTAPGPIAFQAFDPNHEYPVTAWAQRGKQIDVAVYNVPETKAIKKPMELAGKVPADTEAQAEADLMIERFIRDYTYALNGGGHRTVVWDTATELWECLRLARFGKLTNVQTQHYTAVNNEFRKWVSWAYNSDCNLIMVHKMGAEWKRTAGADGKASAYKTGKNERKGFEDIGSICHVMLETKFDQTMQSPFCIEVLKCTQNPMLTGNIYEQVGDIRTNSFTYLATEIFPGTTEDEWK